MIDYIIRGNVVTAYFNYGEAHWKISACNALRKYFKTDLLDDFFDGIVREVIVDKTNFVGKAKCHPDDEFNAEVGKELAKKRLLDNFHKFINRCIKRAKTRLNEIPYISRFVRSEWHTLDFIKNLSNETDRFIITHKLFLEGDR